MCGIAGIISDYDVDNKLSLMKNSLFHRGPDHQSTYRYKNIGLAHTRLSIIDLEKKSNQPMRDESDEYALVYNGEIYNYKELRDELEGMGKKFSSQGDTEVLLQGYIEFGEDFFQRIRGFYAIGILEKKENTLLLARDFFGKKPLFFYKDDKSFYFASEIKAITLALESIPQINKGSLSHYLWKGYYANGETAYSGIKSLLPGERLKLCLSKNKIISRFKEKDIKIKSSFSNPNRNLREVEDSLLESVRSRMIADVPISFLLSGGVDSSIVTMLAREVSAGKIETHYMGYGQKEDEFKDVARLVSKSLDFDHHEHELEEPSLADAANKIVDTFDEPFADYSSIPSLGIYKEIRKNSKVVISGDGADEIFGGYQDSRLFFIKSFFPSFKFNSPWVLDKLYIYLNSSSKFLRTICYLVIIFFLDERILSLSTYRMGWNSSYRRKYMKPEAYISTGANTVETNEAKDYDKSGKNPFEKYLNYDLKRLAYDFLVKVDRTSMANSLELRCPFLDRDMANKINPSNPKDLSGIRKTKKELKSILNKRGYEYVTEIQKKGFTPPLENWIVSSESKKFLKEMILDEKSIISDLFDNKKLLKMLSSDTEIKRNRIRLWHLIVLHTWHNKIYG